MGLSLGFSAGISPGPLMSLVISTALARGFGAALRVAIAPLISDAPVILVCVLVIGSLPPWAQAALSALGGLIVIYLGVQTLRESRTASLAGASSPAAPPRTDLWRGLLVNLVSPHPWIFWITIGGPLLVTLAAASVWQPVAFLAGFYVLLVGSKIAVAAAVAGGRRWLSQRSYRIVLGASGALLILFGLLLFRQALP